MMIESLSRRQQLCFVLGVAVTATMPIDVNAFASITTPRTSTSPSSSRLDLHHSSTGSTGSATSGLDHNSLLLPPSSSFSLKKTKKKKSSSISSGGDDIGSSSTSSSSSSTELSAFATATMEFEQQPFKVFCDMDGVLVDFEKGVTNLLNTHPNNVRKGTMWKKVARSKAFFARLPWKNDGQKLWNAIRPLQPNILTGVPFPKQSRTDKFHWCKRELGLDYLHHVDMAAGIKEHECVNGNCIKEGVTNVITCWSNNKHFESGYKSVLIDDRDDLRKAWEDKGGIFVHHVDTDKTIQTLREHGVL